MTRVLIGLGNPGREYERSRHNLGFQVVDRVAARLALSGWRRRFDAEVLRGQGTGGGYLLVKPQTYMNRSGRAVQQVLAFHKLEPGDCLVVVDDLELGLGRLRARLDGGHGGHNGLRSVIEHVGEGFKRLRIGIGRPEGPRSVTGHVLGATTPEEDAVLAESIEAAAEMAIAYLESGRFESWSSP